MSEKLTRIRLLDQHAFPGWMDWGERTADEMIAQVRRFAKNLRDQADAIDAAADDRFQIDVIKGPYAQHHIRVVQEARK